MWKKSIGLLLIIFININTIPNCIAHSKMMPQSVNLLQNNEFKETSPQFIFQTKNLSISISVMKIIVIRGEIIFNIVSNISTNLHILFIFTQNTSYFQFTQPNMLNILPGLTHFRYILNMSIFTNPGRYEFFISIYQVILNDFEQGTFLFVQPFEIFILGGPIFFYISTILLGFILFFTIIQREVLTKLPPLNSKVRRRKIIDWLLYHLKYPVKNQIIFKGNKELHFIRCPDCGKRIIEGIAFCPECGYHLRRFERFSFQ